MSFYEQLSCKGVDYSKRFFEYREECRQAAKYIGSCYSEYLQAPPDSMSFMGVTKDLSFLSDKQPLSGSPVLTLGCDGFYYFALNLYLCGRIVDVYSMTQICVLGVSARSQRLFIRRNEETFDVPQNEPVKLIPLFERMVDESLAFYDGEVAQKMETFGFVPGTTNERA
jgi:hypothetical protein